ncbi:hypothetical protein B0H15DRAFT_925906 [Mycena belliarum]|uniref:Uncharacterized protein n=1 Tax=Mycena belliarum TaxID=1033014 RepID=A0AAD6TRM6_9AGAR|nr:hypothetical protein B0H15DRAFT_925906 [Mycena belliae]
MTLVDWDGRSPRPLVDKESRVIAVLGGRPNDPAYDDLTEEAARQMEAASGDLKFRAAQAEGRRGSFSSLSYGISFGGGQQTPGNLRQSTAASRIIETLFLMECFYRIAGFANAATLNFGPMTVTLPHIDGLNLAWGWCAITALGSFNPDLGGHLVLWDLKLIIRFPPGSTILIPSAILRHSNVVIQPGEQRYLFTQFTAAGLFRWVDNGFKSDLTAARSRASQTRWREGIDSFKQWAGGP